MSFRFAVLAREGRGGGDVPTAILLAANGSLSMLLDGGELRWRAGAGLCREFLALAGEEGACVLEEELLGESGGGGACLDGTKDSW